VARTALHRKTEQDAQERAAPGSSDSSPRGSSANSPQRRLLAAQIVRQPGEKARTKGPCGIAGAFRFRRTSPGPERPPERNEGTERSSRFSGVGQDTEPAEFLTAAVVVAASRNSATPRCTSGWSCEMAVLKVSSKRVRQFHGSTLSSTCA